MASRPRRPAAFLLFSLLLACPSPGRAAKETGAKPPGPWQMTAPEGAALTRALEDSDALTPAQRDLLVGVLRRAIANDGAVETLTADEKRALLDAAYAQASVTANSDELAKSEKVRQLKDWVALLDRAETKIYPQLPPQPNRYIVGKGVGAVGQNTPIPPDEPKETTPETPRESEPSQSRSPGQPRSAPALPPVPESIAPGSVITPNGDGGWSPAAGPSEANAETGPSEADAARARDQAMSRMGGARAAAGGAGALGGALQQGTREAESLPGDGGRAPGAPGFGAGPGAPGGGGAAAGGDPSRPATTADLALAQGPYKPAFEAAGLKVENRGGVPAVLRRDGSPASPVETRALAERVSAMPTAAMRSPGYLDPAAGGVSWERFSDLKRGYAARPDLRATEFKHIGLSADERDFKRTESCDKISGSCNDHAKASYKRGDDVPASDLNSIWSKINKYLTDTGVRKAEGGAARAAVSTAGIWAKIRRVFGGGRDAAPAVAAGRAPRGRTAYAAAGAAPGLAANEAEEPAGDAEDAAAAGAATRAAGAPPAPRRPSAATGLLVAAGVALLVIPALRSRWARDL